MRNLPWKWIGVAALLALFTIGAVGNAIDDDSPSPRRTSTEAACEMIADGDTAEEAYNILLGLDVRPTTASRAVNRAVAGDC
jgi:hypothetical protein